MTRRQIVDRISEMLNQYGWSNTWPAVYQQEYEKLCKMLHKRGRE